MFRVNPADFEGPYKSLLIEYLRIKESMGLEMASQKHAVSSLNGFLVRERGHERVGIGEDDVREWVARGKTRGGRANRFSVIDQFCSYLQLRGHEAFRGDSRMYRGGVPFRARILSDAELAAFFEAADSIDMPPGRSPYDHSLLFPLLARMLYGSGLRVSEAVSLKVDDIDLPSGRMDILDSKNGDSRVVYASGSLVEAIEGYMGAVRAVPGDGRLLRGCDGRPYARAAAERAMRAVRARAGLDGAGQQPLRLHDLRHNFAVRAMEKMADEGMDLYAAMPYLCKFMGHSDIRKTEYYIQLAPRAFGRIAERAEAFAGDVVPDLEGGAL